MGSCQPSEFSSLKTVPVAISLTWEIETHAAAKRKNLKKKRRSSHRLRAYFTRPPLRLSSRKLQKVSSRLAPYPPVYFPSALFILIDSPDRKA